MYGRTQSASEDVEYVNAAHVFSDILAVSQEYQRSISPEITDLPSPRDVIPHSTRLIIDLRSQRFAWKDSSFLG